MKTHILKIYGRVQGVGFRPFVYRLAKELNLRGYVLNTTSNVEVALQGDVSKINEFVLRLKRNAPPISRIERIESFVVDKKPLGDFLIKESKVDRGFNFISPDIAVCDDCLREMFAPEDRRYKYPFINCTNCGPRYTIIEDLPYDRDRTTMKVFKMCNLCKEEYENPLSRRFHAQPNACFNCGPSLWLEKDNERIYDIDRVFDTLSRILEEGEIVAIKGIGGFHFACDATNTTAIRFLRKGKNRRSKPFALMMKDIDMVRRYCYLSNEEESILNSKEKPIVLLKIKDFGLISTEVAPDNNYLGIMLPYAPYHHLIFEKFSKPIVMTSGNISDEPIVKDNDEAKKRLKSITHYFVLHNRDIRRRIDDSVVFVEKGKMHFIRRARGFVPNPVNVSVSLRPVLGLGGDLKNTFSLGSGSYVFISPHIGDLKNRRTLSIYEETINDFIRLFKIDPEIVVSDMHPEYISRAVADKFKNEGKIVKYIQHHKAHAFSLILDRDIKERIVVFTFDGTGYGDDGNIWGGEVFFGGLAGFERVAHFKYFPLIGGDSAIMNPKIPLFSYIYKNLPFHLEFILKKYDDLELNILYGLIRRSRLLTSSCGRVFDIVSSLIEIRDRVDYEGHAAIELEMVSNLSNHMDVYPFKIIDEEVFIVDFDEVIDGIILDYKKGRHKSYIGRKFHNTLGKMMFDLSGILREKFGVKRLGFSGGVFQNRLLINILYNLFVETDFNLFFHENVPTNDGGVSLGQVVMGKE